MPTPGGKPQVGETIKWISDKNGNDQVRGVVLHRSDGDIWSLKVRWIDGPRKGYEHIITEAGHWMNKVPGFVLLGKVNHKKRSQGPNGEQANYLWLIENDTFRWVVKAYTKNRALDKVFGTASAGRYRGYTASIEQIGVVLPATDWSEGMLIAGPRQTATAAGT